MFYYQVLADSLELLLRMKICFHCLLPQITHLPRRWQCLRGFLVVFVMILIAFIRMLRIHMSFCTKIFQKRLLVRLIFDRTERTSTVASSLSKQKIIFLSTGKAHESLIPALSKNHIFFSTEKSPLSFQNFSAQAWFSCEHEQICTGRGSF